MCLIAASGCKSNILFPPCDELVKPSKESLINCFASSSSEILVFCFDFCILQFGFNLFTTPLKACVTLDVPHRGFWMQKSILRFLPVVSVVEPIAAYPELVEGPPAASQSCHSCEIYPQGSRYPDRLALGIAQGFFFATRWVTLNFIIL